MLVWVRPHDCIEYPTHEAAFKLPFNDKGAFMFPIKVPKAVAARLILEGRARV